VPAHSLALLPQQDQALIRIRIPRAQRQRAATAAGGLGMQPQQQRVQIRVVARVGGDLVDLRQPGIRHGPPGGRQAAGLGYLPRRVVHLGDQPVVLGVTVQTAQRGDEVLGGAAPAAGVTAHDHVGLHVDHQLPDLRRRGLIQAVAPSAR
jgi:hypothetical protein